MNDPRPLRQVDVAPDHFEIATDDAVLSASLENAVAVCFYDAVEDHGALLHLRFIARGATQSDVTDRTLASDLLLLDRCMSGLGDIQPRLKALQAKIVAHVADRPGAAKAAESVLSLVGTYLEDANVAIVSSDVDYARARRVSFRPSMGQIRLVEREA